MDNVELKDDHSIYNFFYQHPGLLLAIVTAIATGFSFFSDYLYQNIELHYLEYWGYSTNHFHFSISNSSLFVVGVFLFLLYLIVFSFYTSSLTVLHNNFFHIRRWDHRLRLLRKKLDELKIQRHGKKEKAVDKEYDEIAEDISNLQKESCKLKCSTIFSFFFWFLVSLFLIWLLFSFYLSIIAFAMSQVLLSYLVLLAILAAFLFIVLLMSIIINLPTYRAIKRESLKEKTDDEKAETHEYKMRRFWDFKIYEFFSNRKILLNTVPLFVSITVLLFSMMLGIDRSYPNQKTFQVYSQQDKDYVIIYKDTDNYYLNEAWIEGNAIKISGQSHIVIQSDEIVFVSRKFQSVEKEMEYKDEL